MYQSAHPRQKLNAVILTGLLAPALLFAQTEQKSAETKDFEAKAMALREGKKMEMDAESRKREAEPEFIEKQKRLNAEREAKRKIEFDEAVTTIRRSAVPIQARVLSVDPPTAIVCSIRVKVKVKGEAKDRYRLGDELQDSFWIEGVDTSDVVDNQRLDLTVYGAGKYSYTSVDGGFRTVRRFATSPELAAKLLIGK